MDQRGLLGKQKICSCKKAQDCLDWDQENRVQLHGENWSPKIMWVASGHTGGRSVGSWEPASCVHCGSSYPPVLSASSAFERLGERFPSCPALCHSCLVNKYLLVHFLILTFPSSLPLPPNPITVLGDSPKYGGEGKHFIQAIFVEHLLCDRHCSRSSGCDQGNRRGPCSHGVYRLVGDMGHTPTEEQERKRQMGDQSY